MANFNFSEFVEPDLKEIWLHIAEYNKNAADQLIDELFEKFILLAENPKIGRTHHNFILNLRSFPHKKYIIFYFPTENGAEIYRVLHGARNIKNLFDEYFEGLKP